MQRNICEGKNRYYTEIFIFLKTFSDSFTPKKPFYNYIIVV